MMTLGQTLQRINAIADQLLVNFAENPESRFMITLPPLQEDGQEVPIMDCQEYNYGIARLREIITYKYLLNAFKLKMLAVNSESLATCIRNLRRSPAIDYYDLGDYHEYAYYFYKNAGQEKKAKRHLLSCYICRGRAILSAGKTFDCKELVMALMKDHDRLQAFLLYVITFIHYDFEEIQDFMERSQYLLLERALVLGVKLFAENAAFDADTRSCIYYVQFKYYERTGRHDLAKTAREAYMKLGGEQNYDLVLERFALYQPYPRLEDELFLDYLLYGNSVDEHDIYPTDEDGNFDFDIEPEDPIIDKDGRSNFMDTYYRPMKSAWTFKDIYDKAEKGDEGAIREVVRSYREGGEVTVCEAAATAWEKKLSC